jgi:hypothetical protein
MPGINRKGKLEKGAAQTNRDLTPLERTMSDDQIRSYKKRLRGKGRKIKSSKKISLSKIYKIRSTGDSIPFGKHQGKRCNAVALSYPNYMKGFMGNKQLSIEPEVFSRLALLVLTSPKYEGKK